MDIVKFAIYGFSLVFCTVGAGLLYGASLSFEDGETTDALLLLIAALAFGGCGLGVFAVTTAGYRTQAREASLRASHPDEPWMWRDDWAAGRIGSVEKNAPWYFWGFAILWNLLSTPLMFFLPEEIIQRENYPALIGLLFPLVGIGLVVDAVRKTIHLGKYGNCAFHLTRVPGVLGGDMTGTILLPRGLQGPDTLTVRLSCIHRVRRRSGRGTSTHENVLWHSEQSVVRLSPTGEAGAQRATVRFRTPYDASPTGDVDRNNSVVWKLEAVAAVPGVDFATGFEVPVFKTLASSPEITEERLR